MGEETRVPIKNYAILPILLLVFAWPTSASENVILARITNMHKASSDMTKIRKSISNSDYQQAREAAESIKNWANIMLDYFPKGSGASINNPSAASSEILEDLESFKYFIENKQKSANHMLSAAENENKQALIKAFNSTRETCNACHEEFRN